MKQRSDKGSTEELRQLWGAQQEPKLMTTVQASKMFGKSFQSFKKFAIENGQIPIEVDKWSRAIFYNQAEMEIFAREYFKKNPPPKREPAITKPIQASPTSFSGLPAGNWTSKEFLAICGISEREKARNVINGSKSIKLLCGEDAAKLIYLLIHNYPRKTVFRKTRIELEEYYGASKKFKEPLGVRYHNLVEIIGTYWEDTDFGYIDPEISVAVLAEMMLSNPAKN